MSISDDLPAVARRFLRYVRIDTQSDLKSKTTPSTAKQFDLARRLMEELRELGIEDAAMDEHGYVYATVPSTLSADEAAATPTVAFFAHVDTSPDEPGGPVEPIVHRDYDGGVIALPGDPSVKIDPAKSPNLTKHVGHDLITSDGTTLLGSDDKAGVAVIMQLAEDLLSDSDHPRPTVKICFTVDEEIGRGVDKLDLERLGADLGYTIDGGEVGHFDNETFNAAQATIKVRGVNVHPGTAKDVMANAATILAKLLSQLPESERPETTEGREGYFCPHEIRATIASAEARVLLRDFTDLGLERRKRLVLALAEAARLEHPRASVEVEIEDNYKNMRSYIEAKDPRVVTFAYRAAERLGMDLSTQSIRGGTDGSRLSELGLPTPNIFTGGHDYHSRFEWNTVQNLETTLTYVKELVRVWAEEGRA